MGIPTRCRLLGAQARSYTAVVVAPRGPVVPTGPAALENPEKEQPEKPEQPEKTEKTVAVGRRVFLGMVALGAAGIAFGSAIQSRVGRTLGSGLAGVLPGGDLFQIYSVSDTFPAIHVSAYRLTVSGLVERPTTFTFADLQAMPHVRFERTFECVTGWRVPGVHWEGVQLSHILGVVGVRKGAFAVGFHSYDGVDTESLTLEQARLPDVIVATRMLGAPITTDHGGPVRLYVAPMFGYKSLKWLSAIRVAAAIEPGYWEQNGYPVNGWLTGSTSAAPPRSA